MSVTLPVSSRELVRVPVTAFSDGPVTSPTALPVDFALLPVGVAPVEANWIAGAWQAGASTPTAQILIGEAGTIVPAAGRYTLWLRVRGAVEQPERPVGAVRVV